MTTDDKPLLFKSGSLYRFNDQRIQETIDNVLSGVEPDDKLVVVAHHVFRNDGTNVTKLTALYRLPAGFSVVAGAYKDWSKGDAGAEGKIVFRGK